MLESCLDRYMYLVGYSNFCWSFSQWKNFNLYFVFKVKISLNSNKRIVMNNLTLSDISDCRMKINFSKTKRKTGRVA